MKEKLSKINIKTKQELKNKVIEIKEEIEGSLIENYIYSMKKRLKEVIKAKGIKLCIKFIWIDSSNIIVIFLFSLFLKIFVDIKVLTPVFIITKCIFYFLFIKTLILSIESIQFNLLINNWSWWNLNQNIFAFQKNYNI